ncbi:heparin lyase I family protein [Microvirga lotononidis]|uniref:heparin lyase I family protein n=1 Tax=Microvirga lotononidis TaxID=864069 RepID=UPI0002FD76C5|nr:heparin lyase I family protein [Microvirga lotononidis]
MRLIGDQHYAGKDATAAAVSAKADASSILALQSAINAKANVSSVATIEAALNNLALGLAGKAPAPPVGYQYVLAEVGGTPPVTLPALASGYIWASQVNPVTYDRSKLVPWGQRSVGSDPSLYDLAKWRVTVPRLPYSWSSSDNNEIIFEVRSGDRYGYPTPEGGWTDPVTSERSELQSEFLVPVAWNSSMGWKSKLVGSQNTAPWCVLMQAFARNNGAGMGSPAVALTLEGNDTCQFIIRRGSTSNPQEVYLKSFPFPRGVDTDIWVEWKYSTTGNGYARLYVNNQTIIAAENINVGYTGQTHFEPTVGIYRRAVPETLKHHVKDMRVSW